MNIGFTGTRNGMTVEQMIALKELLNILEEPLIAHHGDCVGADKNFHDIIKKFRPNTLIHIHPPSFTAERAFCKGDVLLSEEDYRTRNYNIVDSCDILIAAPYRNTEESYSGTWMTVRYARRKQKRHVIIWPTGKMKWWN